MLPHRFYPIVNSVEWIERLLLVGVKFIQYRNKGNDQESMRPEVRRALELAREYDAQVVINDYWQLAIEEGASWVHLGQSDLDGLDRKTLKEANIRLGTSTHNHEELERALSFEPDYVALGPVFHTISKEMVFGPQGLEKVTEWKKLLGDIPLVAIGGIRADTAPSVLEAGADAVACIGDVTMNENPEQRAKEWLTLVQNYKNTTSAKSVA